MGNLISQNIVAPCLAWRRTKGAARTSRMDGVDDQPPAAHYAAPVPMVSDDCRCNEEQAAVRSPACDRHVHDAIDQYVERWFAANPSVDVGQIHIPCIGDVDVLPDYVEKALYKRMHALLLTNLMQTEITLCGVKLRLQPVVAAADDVRSLD